MRRALARVLSHGHSSDLLPSLAQATSSRAVPAAMGLRLASPSPRIHLPRHMGRAQPGGSHGPAGRTCSPAHTPGIIRAPSPPCTPSPHRNSAGLSLTGSACARGWRSLYGRSNRQSVAEVSDWSRLTQVTASGYVRSVLARSALQFQSRSLWRLGTGGRDRHSPPPGPRRGAACAASPWEMAGGWGSALLLRTGGSEPCGAGTAQGWGCPGTTMPALCSWYFSGISRTEARQLLLSPANAPSTRRAAR